MKGGLRDTAGGGGSGKGGHGADGNTMIGKGQGNIREAWGCTRDRGWGQGSMVRSGRPPQCR